MTGPIYIVDVIGITVNAVSTQVLAAIQANEAKVLGKTNIQNINYQYGHRQELLETLKQMDTSPASKFLKFPLFYLVMDFVEQRGKQPGIYAELALSIILAHQTEATKKTTERYRDVFKPVLYPIYYSFMDQLAHQMGVENYNEDLVPHSKIDRPYWGKDQKANLLSDFVDAIEIMNLNLKINLQSCIPAVSQQ